MAVTTGTVTGRFEDMTPGAESITGSVYFTAEADYLISDSTILLPKPVKVDLVGSAFSVVLVATDDPTLNPVDWTYKVTFDLVVDGARAKRDPFSIKVPAGQVTDLAAVSPVAASRGNAILVGPTGPVGPQGIQGVPGVNAPFTSLSVVGTTTGPDTVGQPGPQGMKGDKGDPGGITLGTDLGTTNLNTILTAGVYRQVNGVNCTVENGYPVTSNATAVMTVLGVSSTNVIQQFEFVLSTHSRRVFWQRSTSDGGINWTTWVAYGSQRTDVSVGRRIFIWDDVNSREQQVYGDTGERDIRIEYGNGTFAALKIRRVGSTVTLTCVGWNPPANSTANLLLSALPAGWRNNNTLVTMATENGSVMKMVTCGANTSSIAIGGNLTGAQYNFHLTYQTVDAWPASLIGQTATDPAV